MKNAFHEHLDRCAQCERNPHALCAIGADLLRREFQLPSRDIEKELRRLEQHHGTRHPHR